MTPQDRAQWLRRYFLSRSDLVAFKPQWPGTRIPACPSDVLSSEQLDALLLAHVAGEAAPAVTFRWKTVQNEGVLTGRFRIGSYTPAPDGTTRWGCIDFDGGGRHKNPLKDPAAAALKAQAACAELGVPAYIERSGGGSGFHLWVFFDKPAPAKVVRSFCIIIAPRDVELASGGPPDILKNIGCEAFPKAEKLRGEAGKGNLVWLPYWSGAADGGNRFYRAGPDGALEEYEPEIQPAPLEVVERVVLSANPEVLGQKPPKAPSKRSKRSALALASTWDEAVERYNADHQRDYPRASSECPACGGSGFKASTAENSRRWVCFSTRHERVGIHSAASACWSGDALDLAAAQAGCEPKALLQREGYLPVLKDTAQREEPPHPADDPDARPPWSPQVILGDGMAKAANEGPDEGLGVKVASNGERRARELRSRSPLSILQICREPFLRNQVRFLRGKKIELDTMANEVTIGGLSLTETDVANVMTDVELGFDDGEDGGGLIFTPGQVETALHQVAALHPYHPVQDYLRGLVWDGVERLLHVAELTLGVPDPTPLTRAMLRRWFIAAVARAQKPGTLVKQMLVLVGDQNAGKSSWFRALVPHERFFTDKKLDIGNKEAEFMLARVWICEWAEMQQLQGKSAEAVKAFISSQSALVIPKYSNKAVDLKRGSVMVGSSNPAEILQDPTGNVRFHPVQVGKLDLVEVVKIRDQLWAEAVAAHARGEQHWLTEEEEGWLREAQKDFQVSSALDYPVLEAADGFGGQPFGLDQLIAKLNAANPKKTILDVTPSVQQEIANVLRRGGYDNNVRQRVGLRQIRLWQQKDGENQ